MLLVSAVVTLAVLVYSIGQGMTGDERETPRLTIYHPTFLVLAAGVSNAFLAGDLFNLFVSFEMLLFASYVLLTLGGTGARIRAGTIYVVVNVLSSSLFLISIAAVYAATGSLNLAQLAGRIDDLPASAQPWCCSCCCSPRSRSRRRSSRCRSGCPTATRPLPRRSPPCSPACSPRSASTRSSAPRPCCSPTARSPTCCCGRRCSPWSSGILGAVAQTDIKRMLSFTLVSHIGYMMFGIAPGHARPGYSGAIFYVAHHITIQTTLFLVLGLVERRGGSTSLIRLGGLARLAPLLGVLFFVPAMNLAGIPPMSGFLGKVGAHRGRPPGRHPAGLRGGRRRHAHQPADAVRRREGLEPRLLAHAGGGARAWPGELSDLGPDRQAPQMSVRHRDHVHVGAATFDSRDQDEARQHPRRGRRQPTRTSTSSPQQGALPTRLPRTMVGATGAWSRSASPSPSWPGRSSATPDAPPRTCSTASSTSPRCCPEGRR